MGLLDRLRRRALKPDSETNPMPRLTLSFDDDGANFFTTPEDFAVLQRGEGERSAQEQVIVLEQLTEQGEADRMANGYSMTSESVVRLDMDESTILTLPPRFSGQLVPRQVGNTTTDRFEITLSASDNGDVVPLRRDGPTLRIGSDRFLLTPAALAIITAVERHQGLPTTERSESNNVRLIAEIKSAKQAFPEDSSVQFSLGALDRFTVTTPASVGLVITPESDGSLTLEPDLGAEVDADALRRRWHQLQGYDRDGVIRVDNQVVLLEEKQLAGVREVQNVRTIPAHQVAEFTKAPGTFLDADVVNIDVAFGVRVQGVGVIVPQTFTDAEESGIFWFDMDGVTRPTSALATILTTPDQLATAEQAIELARTTGRDVVAVENHLVDIADQAETASALDAARRSIAAANSEQADSNDSDDIPERTSRVQVGIHLTDEAGPAATLQQRAANRGPAVTPDYANLLRTPFPHQREGIEWMAGLIQEALEAEDDDPLRTRGGLLADDMGLGKTFMTLATLGEYGLGRLGHPADRPCLAVLPLALIDTWERELASTLRTSPFDDVVVLQSDRDLGAFRIRGAGKETRTDSSQLDASGMLAEDKIQFALRVGDGHGEGRLDRPRRLVLTTYETLASYQLSLSQVEWGMVVLDEAQNIKNPDSLRSRAARALKSQFMLLATGTPIENSMRDFWTLMDTAQPGLLGTWSEFAEDWVRPMAAAEGTEKESLGRDLRETVGRFMLRRMKEDHLPHLPSKTIYGPTASATRQHRPDLGVAMPRPQQTAYEKVLETFAQASERRAAQSSKSEGRDAALRAVHGLRAVSLHPDAVGDTHITLEADGVRDSGRLVATLAVLDEVRARGEKVIVFVINKKVQRALASWLGQIYGLPIRIVNGETPAATRGAAETRSSIIRNFEDASGFNVIIMSPLAVGVGLTVVGANHAIHLERHWNPAKEAQATDRIYRIGQTRPVHVYLPMSLHPNRTSFDENLDQLLQQKTTLREAIVVPQQLDDSEVAATLGLL